MIQISFNYFSLSEQKFPELLFIVGRDVGKVYAKPNNIPIAAHVAYCTLSLDLPEARWEFYFQLKLAARPKYVHGRAHGLQQGARW